MFTVWLCGLSACRCSGKVWCVDPSKTVWAFYYMYYIWIQCFRFVHGALVKGRRILLQN
jgi:hypothetical protein